MKKLTEEEILVEYEKFCDDRESMIISSVDESSNPLTSYSPFVKEGNIFYTTMSSSLPHYKNIESSKKAHIMILEDEKEASHIFARKRLYFSASCEIVDKNSNYSLFEKRFGDKLAFIKSMGDFKIVKISPKEKSLVLGFGAAYTINEEGKLNLKNISHK